MFAHWIQERIQKYEFIEIEDYITIEYELHGNPLAKNGNTENQHVSKREYASTIDMAKELCMVENNEMGMQARRYFIDYVKNHAAQSTEKLSNKELALMVIAAEEEKERRTAENCSKALGQKCTMVK